MAAGHDIKRQTILIRREQAERNRIAVAEKEARLNEMAEIAGLRPSERRRHAVRDAGKQRVVSTRVGRRIEYEVIEPVVEPEPGLDEVQFASSTAEKLAREEGLTESSFNGHEPSGVGGYTTGDVRSILAKEREREEKMEDPAYQDKMLRGWEDK